MTADFTPGSRLGEYVLDAYVGAGSFGIVWRGHAEPGGETVAIKLLTGALSSGDAASMRGDVEVLAATAASSSPNVVRVLGGGSQPVPYIVMEYVQGTDLAAMLQTETKLTPARTIDVGLAIAGALQVLHQARIVHRDIKPANVLVDTHGVIKLTDFGVAKIVGYETITMTGQVAMTMAYAAPEVWEDDDDGDLRFGRPSHRSDLYALGILLYQCLCGVTPFRGNYGVLYRAHRERPPDLSTLPPETPASLREAIRRCLEKRQQDRPVDAAEAHLMLQRASVELAEAEGAAPKDEPSRFGPWLRVSPHPTLPWAWRCRHETSGAEATVEVYFAEDIDTGEELRRVTKANAKLAQLGAEKVIESNRLLMRPQESWTSPPPGEFQFWVAREDRQPEAAKSVSARTLQRGVVAVDALIEAAARERIGLSLRDNLTLTAAGEIYLTRVGLAPGSEYLLEQAMAVLRALPLDADARAFIPPAGDFANLVARATTALETDDEPASPDPFEARAPDSTELVCRSCHEPLKPGDLICGNCGHYQGRDAATVMVDGSQSSATRLSQATELAPSATPTTGSAADVQARLQDLGGGEYELVFTNAGARAQTLQLKVSSKHDRLRVELPAEVTVAPAATERVKVTVSAKKERRFGGKKRYHFTLVASGAGGIGEPPLTIEGEFEDEPSVWPMFAVAFGVASAVALLSGILAWALIGSGRVASPQSASASTDLRSASDSKKPQGEAAPGITPTEGLPTQEENRADCDTINGTSYLSPSEGSWFRANCENSSAGAGRSTQGASGVSSASNQSIVGCWSGPKATLNVNSVTSTQMEATYSNVQTSSRTYNIQPDGSLKSTDGGWTWVLNGGVLSGSHTIPTGQTINDVLTPCGPSSTPSVVQAPPIVSPPALPTTAPASPRICPAPSSSGSDTDKFKGCLVYEASMDGTSNSFTPPRTIAGCRGSGDADATASDVKFTPGAMELSIAKQFGNTAIGLKIPSLQKYVVEYELAFLPGSENQVKLTVGSAGQSSLILYLEPRGEVTFLSSFDTVAGGSKDLTTRSPVSGIKAGRRITYDVAVGGGRYSAFVDGRMVVDYTNSQSNSIQRPALGTQACGGYAGIGTLRVFAIRVYELAGQ